MNDTAGVSNVLPQIDCDDDDCLKRKSVRGLHVYCWTGREDGQHDCTIRDRISCCFVGFRYIDWRPPTEPRLGFQVRTKKGNVEFPDETDPATWVGGFEGLQPQLILRNQRGDSDSDRALLGVVREGQVEFLYASFDAPGVGAQEAPSKISLRLHVETLGP